MTGRPARCLTDIPEILVGAVVTLSVVIAPVGLGPIFIGLTGG